ncbi:hapless 2-like [Dysidea avara]|uniref:hapless 2-like n=1 Tax=Dysidea avara TaxID=196820 RepID=UPI00333399B6
MEIFNGRLTLLILLVTSVCVVDGSLVASSKVQICRKLTSEPLTRSGENCDKKFVVALSVRNGKGETDQLVANIRYVENETTTLRREQLRKPFRIVVTKSDVHIHYPLVYLGYVNNGPKEYSIIKYSWVINQVKCNDQPLWRNKGKDKSTCGHKRGFDGRFVKDSQGFCCKHTKAELNSKKWQYRRGKGKKVSWHYVNKHSEAICMKQNELWYYTFEVMEPFLTYKINVTVQQLDYSVLEDDADGEGDVWRTIGYVVVGPHKIGDNTANSYGPSDSSGPQIKVTWEGDFLGSTSYTNLLHKYLLIPEWQRVENPHLHKQIIGGQNEWLIVDKHMVDLYDRECNRIGSSYKAFRFQNHRCNRNYGACHEITAKKLFDHAHAQKQNGIESRFFPPFYGEFVGPYYQESENGSDIVADSEYSPSGALEANQSAAPVRLVYKSQQVHNSLVVLTFTADSISFVSNRSPGRIVEAFIQDFSALGEAGNLHVIVQNIGRYTADYEVVIESCTDGIIRVSTKQKTIDPREQAEFFFQISASLNIDANHTCYINLLDTEGVSLDRTPIQFSTFRTCYCLGQCECRCDDRELRTTSELCDKKRVNPFWTPPVIIEEEKFCYHCWFTDSFKNPVSATFVTIMILLCVGMGKMFFVHFCCRYKDGRPIDVVGIVLGTTNMRHTKEKTRNATIQFLLGVCFFVYLPILPLMMMFCHWRRKKMARKRMKKKVERKKRRIMLRKRAALAAMKGMMVAEIGTGRQVDGGLEATFAQMKGPRGAAPKLPKKLVVSSTSSDTSEYEFGHSDDTTGEDDADTILLKDPKKLKLARPKLGKK